MNILIFLQALLFAYWTDVLLVVIVVAILGMLYKRGKRDLVKEIIYTLVVKAEKELGSATGSAKYSQVITTLYEKLPLILRIFFSKTEINKYIDDSVKWLKAKLQEPNINLLTYSEEAALNSSQPITLNIENFTSKQSAESIAEELQFYMKQNTNI